MTTATVTLRKGRVCMSPEEIRLLAATVANADGDHCEIGSLWGGTAIIAALAKPDCQIVCIDPFTDPDADGGQPTPETFWANVEAAGFAERMELHVCKSAPWPVVPASRRFGSVLIDGDHRDPWPETDWESARCVTDTIILHDVNWHEPAVAKLNERVKHDPTWRRTDHAKFLYVYERAV